MKRFLSVLLTMCLLGSVAGCAANPAGETQGETDDPGEGASSEPKESSELQEDQRIQEILSEAEARKEAILNSETSIVKSDTYVMGETYTGTAYYISNGGDDGNDGLSPESPFATVEPLRNIQLQFGDAIFFERGGLWRSCEIPVDIRETEGITYSAYGQGEKPRLYASAENGAGGEKWSLFYEEGDKKIWLYYKDMADCGAVVAGEDHPFKREVAYWNGSKYLKLDERDQLTGEDYRVEEHLQNGYCFPFLEYTEEDLADGCAYLNWNNETRRNDCTTGPLYLRCDEGNPGELFDSIEFIQPQPLSEGFADYTVYDNLNYSYCTCTLTSGSYQGIVGCHGVIQNCELSWMGGHVSDYATGLEEGDTRVALNGGLFGRMGGAITINGSDYLVRDNYVHNCFQEGIAVETFDGDPSIEDVTVSGNLVTHCVQSLLLCNWDMEVKEDHIFKNCTFEDNLVLYSGENNFLSHLWEEECESSAFTLQGGPCAHDGALTVRNNTFAFSRGSLILVGSYSEEYSRVFEGNTYVQFPDRRWLYTAQPDAGIYDPQEAIVNRLDDADATLIRGGE